MSPRLPIERMSSPSYRARPWLAIVAITCGLLALGFVAYGLVAK